MFSYRYLLSVLACLISIAPPTLAQESAKSQTIPKKWKDHALSISGSLVKTPTDLHLGTQMLKRITYTNTKEKIYFFGGYGLNTHVRGGDNAAVWVANGQEILFAQHLKQFQLGMGYEMGNSKHTTEEGIGAYFEVAYTGFIAKESPFSLRGYLFGSGLIYKKNLSKRLQVLHSIGLNYYTLPAIVVRGQKYRLQSPISGAGIQGGVAFRFLI